MAKYRHQAEVHFSMTAAIWLFSDDFVLTGAMTGLRLPLKAARPSINNSTLCALMEDSAGDFLSGTKTRHTRWRLFSYGGKRIWKRRVVTSVSDSRGESEREEGWGGQTSQTQATTMRGGSEPLSHRGRGAPGMEEELVGQRMPEGTIPHHPLLFCLGKERRMKE